MTQNEWDEFGYNSLKRREAWGLRSEMSFQKWVEFKSLNQELGKTPD
jgi:hypothetical protein